MSGSIDYDNVLRELMVDGQIHRAAERRVRNLQFGPFAVSMSIVGEPFENAIMPTIQHAENGAGAGMRITATDFEGDEPDIVANLAESFPSDTQYVRMQSGSGVTANWDSLPRFLQMYHAEANEGMMFLSRLSLMPGWDRAAPLRHVLHWMTVPTSHVVVHGASLFHENTGLLLAGRGGAGKSTTTARALIAGFSSVGDDLLLVDADSPSPVAHALYDAVKVDPVTARVLCPSRQINWTNVDSCDGKKLCKISELAEGALVKSHQLNAILVPHVVDSPVSRILPGVATDALRVIASSTMTILRGGEQETLAKMARIARSLPTYRLELGNEPAQLVDLLRQFCRDLGR